MKADGQLETLPVGLTPEALTSGEIQTHREKLSPVRGRAAPHTPECTAAWPGVLFKGMFGWSRSGQGLGLCIGGKLPGGFHAADLRTSLCVGRLQIASFFLASIAKVSESHTLHSIRPEPCWIWCIWGLYVTPGKEIPYKGQGPNTV